MSLTHIYGSSCDHCHSFGTRVEYEQEGRNWIKKELCLFCKSDINDVA